jgi:hypothetical protein
MRRSAGLYQCLHADQIGIDARFRIDAKNGGHAMSLALFGDHD